MRELGTIMLILFSVISLAGCTAQQAHEPPSSSDMRISVERVFPNLSLKQLTNLAQPNDDHNQVFVTRQPGLVLAFANKDSVDTATVFLDLRDRVSSRGNEEGLLGITFHPDYKTNGYTYLYYTADPPKRSVLSRFTTYKDDPSRADINSELVILEIPQFFSNHNGGQLAFGPDGYLYIGLGDGGARGDPLENGQDRTTLLGSILRIDVDNRTPDHPYAIPPDNPFVGISDTREEIWAYGLRNPWRFSFDADTGELWAGDVGQNKWEEINLIEKGSNYGWNIMEGYDCFDTSTSCERNSLRLPIAEYTRSSGCSVTGGYVYRGTRLPSLFGHYIYGDYCSGNIWGFRYENNVVSNHSLLHESDLSITSFGEDQERNLYILSRNQGIYRLTEEN
jgi:glucose/arabinose dehydrogenase